MKVQQNDCRSMCVFKYNFFIARVESFPCNCEVGENNCVRIKSASKFRGLID